MSTQSKRLGRHAKPRGSGTPAGVRLRHGLSFGTVLIGTVVLVGWLCDQPMLKSMVPGLTTMKANTAISLLAAGCAVWLIPASGAEAANRRWRLPLSTSLAALVVMVGVLTLVEYAFGTVLGIDELLFTDLTTTSPPYSGRMSPATALGLAFCGTAILCLNRACATPAGGNGLVATAHLMTIVPAAVGYLSLAGYAYKVEGLYSFGAFVTVAIHTATGLLLLVPAILLTLPDRGWRRVFVERPTAERKFAGLLPFCLLVPFGAGALVVQGARGGFYDALYGPALFALVAACCLVGMAWRLSSANAELERLARHLTRARNEAESANRAKSRFLAGVTHELRTPLNGILGYAHLLRMDGELSPAQSTRVDAMLNAGAHLLKMINRVLDLSEIEAERAALQLSEADPLELARSCLDLVHPAAEAKRLRLAVVAAPGLPSVVTTDPTRLRQILLNLLGNAVKFTAEGSVQLRVETTPDNARLRFEVVDTGPGIPLERRDRLFRDFERLAAERDTPVEGAGLGLAVSARLAAMMGGALGQADNPGGGSVFWLEVPLPQGTAASAVLVTAPRAPTRTECTPAPSLRVLVVDDVEMNRDIAGAFLHAAGHVVLSAADGAEAVEMVAGADFDVVLMDVRMPGMGGLEATRRIRALSGERALVPVVALTAQVFTEQIELCLQAGMDSHLAKPFDPATLVAAVTQAAEAGRGRQRERRTAQPTGERASNPAETDLLVADLPILDGAAFQRTASMLAPGTVATYLQAIAGRGDALLHQLHRSSGAETARADVAKAAHTLSGSAGMFGFARLAMAARRFEHALEAHSPSAAALEAVLADAIAASLDVIASTLEPGGAEHLGAEAFGGSQLSVIEPVQN